MANAVEPRPNVLHIEGWLTAQGAARHMGVSREYVYRLKSIYEEGGAGIPGFLLGEDSHVLMFRIKDLDAYMKAHPDLGSRASDDEEEDEPDDEDDEEGDGDALVVAE